jgi:adenosine deaminase
VHTGAAADLPSHPFPILQSLGFRLTLNTDNRLMSRTTLTQEYQLAAGTFGLDLDDLETLSINAMKSAFAHYDVRCRLIFDKVKAGFAAVRKQHALPPRKRYGYPD